MKKAVAKKAPLAVKVAERVEAQDKRMKATRKAVKAAAPVKLKKQRVDVSKLAEGASPLRGKEDKAVRLAGGHQKLPLDLPAYITITRLLNEADGAVEAHVISVDLFTYGRTVHIRVGKKAGWRKGKSPETGSEVLGSVKIWVNKTKVYEGKDDDKDNVYKNGAK